MSTSTAPLVSVVTPFYNTERFLAECIESVLAQTYDNWEYVLVNNQSTDRSAEIANEYAKADSRIRVVNTADFLSQIANYNFALTQISTASKYCKIVQADDWMFPECLTRMVEVAERDPTIGVVAGYRLQGTHVDNDGVPFSAATWPGRDICRLNLLLDGRQLFGSPTTVMMRSAIVREKAPFYANTPICEDSDAIFDVLRHCNFGFVHQVCVYERQNAESISSSIDNFDPTWLLAKLIRIKRFGPVFLLQEEYKARFRDVEQAYLRFLAQNALRRRGKDFWSYHRLGLRSVNYDLTPLRMAKHICLEILDCALNPKASAGRALRWLKRQLH